MEMKKKVKNPFFLVLLKFIFIQEIEGHSLLEITSHMENFDLTGRWRKKYRKGNEVDSSGKLMRKHNYTGKVDFKDSLLKEKNGFAKAFVSHLLQFLTFRELTRGDTL